MNDLLSAAADVLTIIGSALTITLEVRRARKEAHRPDHSEPHDDTQE